MTSPNPNAFRSLLLLPLLILAVGCAASTTEDDASGSEALSIKPPISPIPPKSPHPIPPPSTPALYSLTPYAGSVSVKWFSPDDTMNEFIVYRRDLNWNWQPVATEVNNKPDTYFVWLDTDLSRSAQCYMVEALSTSTGLGSYTGEQCTIRPDASAFPQSNPSGVVEWYGLSSTNDGVDPLEVGYSGTEYLQTQNQTFGVNLGLGGPTGENVKAERQGDGATWPLMQGEALAIRVWGAGWLAYGHQEFGLDLVLSTTPVYEWYVLGEGTPGQDLENGPFALWNRTTGDYLVMGGGPVGVNLNWYKKTQPSSGSGPTPPPGVGELAVYNCIADGGPLEMWVDDVTAGTGWLDEGSLASQELGQDSCPAVGNPWTFTPTAGHKYEVRAIDVTLDGCSSTHDQSSCINYDTTFVGGSDGTLVQYTAS